MATWCKRDGDRYIVFRGPKTNRERIGFVRRYGTAWSAADTTMEHARDFATRAEAIAWLETLPA